VDSKDGYLAAIAAYAAAEPNEPWILGGGWSMDVFPRGCPSKIDLDRVIPDRPAFLPNRDGHSAWVNSAALERAGVSSVTRTALPPERSTKGRWTSWGISCRHHAPTSFRGEC
jgi:predicted amidohydrolase YtcJ